MSALPQKRISFSTAAMSALCQKQTHAPQHSDDLLDDLVGAAKDWEWNGEIECFGGH
jgi:hypothetical protein